MQLQCNNVKEIGVKAHRLANFELLRILAMLGVLLSHVFNYGLHIYPADAPDFTVDTSTFWGLVLWTLLQLIKLVSLVSVNCYVLITGYFMASRVEWRWKGIWRVWSTTWFYGMVLYLLFALMGRDVLSWQGVFHNATPLLSNTYWFVTTYLALMLVSPALSYVSCRLNQRWYTILLAVGFVICFQFLLGRYTMFGQQILLFVYLFFIGGYIRKFYADRVENWWPLSAGFIMMLALMYACTVYKNLLGGNDSFLVYGMEYNGLVLPLSVLVFLLFARMRVSARYSATVCAVAPLSFAAYIIHTQPNVHAWLWPLLTDWLFSLPQWLLPLCCLLAAIVVFVCCVIIEGCRRFVLTKIFTRKLVNKKANPKNT